MASDASGIQRRQKEKGLTSVAVSIGYIYALFSNHIGSHLATRCAIIKAQLLRRLGKALDMQIADEIFDLDGEVHAILLGQHPCRVTDMLLAVTGGNWS